MEIIAALKKLREEKGWSQEDLAHELGVSFSTINRWENGKTKPSKMAQAHINRLLFQVQKRRGKMKQIIVSSPAKKQTVLDK